MSFLISDLKNTIEAKMHDTSIDKLTGSFYDKVREASGNILLSSDPIETIRVADLTNGIYDDVNSYVCPTDLKGDRIISIRPRVNNNPSNNFSQTYSEQFDLRKEQNTSSIDFNSGVKTIKLSKAGLSGSLLSETDALSDGTGTWTAGGNALTLSVDTVEKISGSASLKFNLQAAGTSAYIENTALTQVDLSSYKNLGAGFVWVYIPSSAVTAVVLRWGSTSSDYYSVTATAPADATAIRTGWNLFRFDWNGATQTGTPVDTAIDYARVTLTYSSVSQVNNARVDGIVFRLQTPYEIVYYSKFLFRNTAGTWLEIPTSDSDIVNLDTESYNLLVYELAYLIAQEMQGEDSTFDIKFWETKKKEVWDAYKAAYKSQRMKRQTPYYRAYRRS